MLIHRQHVLKRQRLEVQPVARVVVGRHRLRIAVHHDRLVAVFTQRKRRMAAAVVELNSLPDPVRPAPKNHDLLLLRRRRLILFVVAAIEIRREALKLRRARIHHLVHRHHVQLLSQRANRSRALRAGQPPTAASRSSEMPIRFASQLVRCHLAIGTPPIALISSVICLIWYRNHGSIEVMRATSRTVILAQTHSEDTPADPDAASPAAASTARLNIIRRRLLARLQRPHRLHHRFLEGAPIAITSPTDFICGPRPSSAPGNFSNCHFGIFTTT
jgi:hypothetical protein